MAKDALSRPGVCIDRFVGILRRVFESVRKGDAGVEKGWTDSAPVALAGRARGSMSIMRERFLTFRVLLEERSAAGSSLGWDVGADVWIPGSSFPGCDTIIDLKGERGNADVGDSGEELGDASEIRGESKVEVVVVGEESVESEEIEAALSLC